MLKIISAFDLYGIWYQIMLKIMLKIINSSWYVDVGQETSKCCHIKIHGIWLFMVCEFRSLYDCGIWLFMVCEFHSFLYDSVAVLFNYSITKVSNLSCRVFIHDLAYKPWSTPKKIRIWYQVWFRLLHLGLKFHENEQYKVVNHGEGGGKCQGQIIRNFQRNRVEMQSSFCRGS